jgi:hypothetical protein
MTATSTIITTGCKCSAILLMSRTLVIVTLGCTVGYIWIVTLGCRRFLFAPRAVCAVFAVFAVCGHTHRCKARTSENERRASHKLASLHGLPGLSCLRVCRERPGKPLPSRVPQYVPQSSASQSPSPCGHQAYYGGKSLGANPGACARHATLFHLPYIYNGAYRKLG